MQNIQLVYTFIGFIRKVPDRINIWFLNKNEQKTQQMKIWLIQYTLVMTLYSFFFPLRVLVVVLLWVFCFSRSPTARTLWHFMKRQAPKFYNFIVDLALFLSDYAFTFLFSRQRKRIIIRHMLLSRVKNVWLVKKLA